MSAQSPLNTSLFTETVKQGLQAQGTLLPHVMSETYSGTEEAEIRKHMLPVELELIKSKGQLREVKEIEYKSRYIEKNTYAICNYTDKLDKLNTAVGNIDSEIVKTTVAAAQRTVDSVIIDAFFGNASVKNGASRTTETFPATSVVDADYDTVGDVGINLVKIEKSMTMLKDQLIMPLGLRIGMTPKQHALLLKDISATANNIYQEGIKGQSLPTIWGMQIVETTLFERLEVGGIDYLPIWDIGSMHFGWFGNEQIYIDVIQNDPLMALGGQNTVRGHLTIGATRSNQDGAGVIKVACART